MAEILDEVLEAIKNLPKKELEKLVVKAAKKDKNLHDFILVNYFDREIGERVLFDQAKSEIDSFLNRKFRSNSEVVEAGKMLAFCQKSINAFGKNCKQKQLELDLIMFTLEVPFSNPVKMFDTCFVNYNFQVFRLIKKAITIVQTKIHEDYRIEYVEKINKYLEILHKHSNHLDYVYDLPASI